jgi:hypothetical protein
VIREMTQKGGLNFGFRQVIDPNFVPDLGCAAFSYHHTLIGSIPPPNLLNKIARGVTTAKGPNEWSHSVTVTHTKLLDLGRARATRSGGSSLLTRTSPLPLPFLHQGPSPSILPVQVVHVDPRRDIRVDPEGNGENLSKTADFHRSGGYPDAAIVGMKSLRSLLLYGHPRQRTLQCPTQNKTQSPRSIRCPLRQKHLHPNFETHHRNQSSHSHQAA